MSDPTDTVPSISIGLLDETARKLVRGSAIYSRNKPDAVQDLVLHGWNMLCKQPDTPFAYLYRALQNKLTDILRKQVSRSREVPCAENPNYRASVPSAEDEAIRRGKVGGIIIPENVREALSPHEVRLLGTLAVSDTREAAAKTLGITKASIATILSRIRRKVRELP